MRKLLCVLLCLGLLAAAGCQVVDGPGMVYQDPAATQASADPAAVNPAADPTDVQTPAGTSDDETHASGTETVSDAGGTAIVVDFGSYSPRTPAPEAQYTRLREGPISDIEPGNYGLILPFAADALYSENELGYSYQNGRHCGFVTASGMIVCDPTYLGVTPVRVYDYSTGTSKALPLWQFNRTVDVEVEHVDEEYGYTWFNGRSVYGVVAMDGSFVLPCQFASIEGCENSFIGYVSWETNEFEVYDLHGNRLFGSQELKSRYSLDGYFYIRGSTANGESIYELSTEDGAFVLDSSGNVLPGFEALQEHGYIYEFSDGLASASPDSSRYGLIDYSGRWVIQPEYESVWFAGGEWVIAKKNGWNTVMDRAGTVLFTTEVGYLNYAGDGYFSFEPEYYSHTDSDKGKSCFFDSSGNRILIHPRDEYWSYLGNDLFCRSYSEQYPGVLIRDVRTGKELQIDEASSVWNSRDYYGYSGYSGSDSYRYKGQPCLMAWGYIYTNEETYEGYSRGWIISLDLEILAEENNLSIGQVQDVLTGEGYSYVQHDSGVMQYYRPDGSELGSFGREDSVRIANGYVQVSDERSARLYDPDGSLVFCYPLLNYMDD